MLNDQTVSELNHLFGLGAGSHIGRNRYKWQSTLQSMKIGDFLIVPLTSTKELNSEGWNMQHCVANYDYACANGDYQVFSIRNLLRRRVATLGIAFTDFRWQVDQCFGYRNSEVLVTVVEWIDDNEMLIESEEFTDLYYVIQDVARELNALSDENKEL